MTGTDFHALIEKMARREAAIRRSTNSQKTYAGPLPQAEPTNELPVLMWPEDAGRRPTRCLHCRSTFITHEPPSGGSTYGDSTCGLCGRQIVRWRHAGTPTPPAIGRHHR